MTTVTLLFVSSGKAFCAQIAAAWAWHYWQRSPLAQCYQLRLRVAGAAPQPLTQTVVARMDEAGVAPSRLTAASLNTELLAQADWLVTFDNKTPLSAASPLRQQYWPIDEALWSTTEGAVTSTAMTACCEQIATAVRQLIAQMQREYLQLSTAQFGQADVEVCQRQSLYKGFFEMQQLTLRHRLFEGGWSVPFTRELFVRGLAVVALLYDPPRDNVVLVEQFRVGAIADQHSPWLLELVAGIVEAGESPEEVVRREALEEAGCKVAKISKIYEYWTSPGACNERIAIYYGQVDSREIGGVHGLPHEHEDIQVQVVSAAWALAAVESGRIDNAATIIALQWLQWHRDRLRREWRKPTSGNR